MDVAFRRIARGQTMTDKIKISNLYKVFGKNPSGAMDHVRKGASKQQLLDNHGHVLGLRDINIDIPERQIQVIMGLSGSGKSTLIRHVNRLIEPTDGEECECLHDGEWPRHEPAQQSAQKPHDRR